MSGSSLDGLDIAYCDFHRTEDKWEYNIPEAETISFPEHLKEKLQLIPNLLAEEFVKLDKDLGVFIGEAVNQFIKKYAIKKIDYIASHGHTAFHNPGNYYTSQIGSGAHIAAVTNIPTISDFRTMDVALGGQGAPLVPVGDKYLFGDYTYCLNLGGYSNISFEQNGKRIAFDICPVNKAINYLSRKAGEAIDYNGEMAKKGTVNPSLLNELNNLDFYKKVPPKSLGDTWLEKQFLPLLEKDELSINDKLRTVYEHIALQIGNSIQSTHEKKIFTTGGGALNPFLIERIKANNKNLLILPEKKLIEFKEALIFAFMGVLKIKNKPNCLGSSTGAPKDTSGGIIHTI